MKKYLGIMICILALLLCAAANAEILAVGNCGADVSWAVDDQGVMIIAGSGPMDDWKYESQLPNFAYIDDSQSDYVDVVKVVIEDGVTSIGDYAFYGVFGAVKEIDIAGSVKVIGKYAFGSCTGLESLTIPNSVTTIRDWAFCSTPNLKSVTLPSKITLLDQGVFCGSGLTGIKIPSSVTKIDYNAFSDCTDLASITIPNTVKEMPGFTFSGCLSLKSVVLSGGLTEIGDRTFEDCTSLTSIAIPEGVTLISSNAFTGCTALKTVTLPGTLTEIRTEAFMGCTALGSVTLPANLEKTYQSIFENCTGLKSVTIESGCFSLGAGAFRGCTGLTNVSFTAPVFSGNTFADSEAFRGCSSLTEFTVPGCWYRLEDSVFRDCTNLSKVTLSDNVGIIGANAFANTKIQEIALSENVQSVGESAFPKGTVIHAPKDSSAAIWAEKNGYKVIIESGEDILLESITLNKTKATLTRTSANKKPTLKLKIKSFTPENATNAAVTWATDNPEVAVVSDTGKVTALKKGKATIYCIAKDESGVKATCKITVKNQPVTKITLNKTKATLTRTSSNKKPTLQLKVKTILPDDAFSTAVTWSSSDPKIAKVSSKGKVTALKAGKVTITCTAKDGSGIKATCKITVKNKKVTSITLNKKSVSIKKGKTYQLKVKTVKPSTALNKKVVWSSSKKKVATVDENGKVTAKKKGTCYIICTAADGSGVLVKCKVTVK